ncbi:MAG: DUF1801 domain-containing protein [Crocinitomicaceae bacterium]|nr:DUF1801 domain-containing protein [Crocinitomicaceae bacterium]
MNNPIDHYIATFPEETQLLLNQVRDAIESVALGAEQMMKYAMPTYVYYGNLVHFAGYKNHIGFYPAPSGLNAFPTEISKYKNSKGAVQFPINEPMPLELIKKIVLFRMQENETKRKVDGKKIK